MGRTPTAVCIGETMAVLVPEQVGPLEEVRTFRHTSGGAESNVARALVALGISAAWVSRVGDDGFGRRIVSGLTAAGVDTRAVVVDPDRPTGLYFKERGPTSSTPYYYRAGSAASALGPDLLHDPAARALLDQADLIHVSGITAALSPTAHALLQSLLPHPPAPAYYPPTERPRPSLAAAHQPPDAKPDQVSFPTNPPHPEQPAQDPTGITQAASIPSPPGDEDPLRADQVDAEAREDGVKADAEAREDGMEADTEAREDSVDAGDRKRRALVSFDLNWRPALWRGRDGAPLRELLNAADVVLMGADEAATVLGTGDPDELRALLPGPSTLVIKDNGHVATAVDLDGSVSEPALRVEVVEPVGAGDAFAAGYLAGTLRGYDQRRRLRLGHLMAAATLVVHGDHAPPPPAEVVERLLTCSAREWAETVVTASGVRR